jgi:hypothetical protein
MPVARAKRLRRCQHQCHDRSLQELLSALGSVRLAGAEPSAEVIALGIRSGRGELTTAELDAAVDQIAAAAKQRAAGLPLAERATPDEPERSRPKDV